MTTALRLPSYSPGNVEFERAREAENCSRSLWKFTVRAWPTVDPAPYVDNWHVGAICEHLQAVTEGHIHKLIINCPPGLAKSTLVSVMWPAWEWIRKPGEQSIFGSYDPHLALRDSVKCRRVFTSDWYQKTFRPAWKLSGDQNAKGFYTNTLSGNRYTIGMTSGGATGWRGNKVVLDDPNNVAARYNARVKAATYETFNSVISTRINDPLKSSFVIIQQRMATDDMTGMLLAESTADGDDELGAAVNALNENEWVHLKIPMVATSQRCTTFVMGRQFWQDLRAPGELLHPSRWPQERVDYYRVKKLGEEGYAGQFQQEPSPGGGSRFKEEYFQHWKSNGHGVAVLHRRGGAKEVVNLNTCWTFVTCDFAASEEQQADWTVFSTWAVTRRFDLLLLDVRRGQWAEPDIVKNAIDVYNYEGFNNSKHTCFVCEDNGVGMPIRQAMQAAGIPVLPVFIHRTDKFVRSTTAYIRLEAGQVFWPDPRTPWYARPRDGWKEELIYFPAHAHDDQADTFSLAAEAVYQANIFGVADGSTLPKSEVPQNQQVGNRNSVNHNAPAWRAAGRKFFGSR